ncbi:hypothetical protein ACFX2I_007820 [Malus domestica]
MSGVSTAAYVAHRAAQKEKVQILYRDTLNWAVHRHLFYPDANTLRERFETNKHVEDPDTVHYNPTDLSTWLESMIFEINLPPPNFDHLMGGTVAGMQPNQQQVQLVDDPFLDRGESSITTVNFPDQRKSKSISTSPLPPLPSCPNLMLHLHIRQVVVEFELQEQSGVVGDDANVVHDGVHCGKDTLLKQTDDYELATIDAIASSAHSLIITIEIFRGKLQIEEAIELIRLEEDIQVDKCGLVENGYDVDAADLRVKISSVAVFVGLSRRI